MLFGIFLRGGREFCVSFLVRVKIAQYVIIDKILSVIQE